MVRRQHFSLLHVFSKFWQELISWYKRDKKNVNFSKNTECISLHRHKHFGALSIDSEYGCFSQLPWSHFLSFLKKKNSIARKVLKLSKQIAGFSAEPALPAFCRLAFDFAGFNENLVAFCRLESFAGFTFLPAGGHFASLKLNQRDETLSFPS